MIRPEQPVSSALQESALLWFGVAPARPYGVRMTTVETECGLAIHILTAFTDLLEQRHPVGREHLHLAFLGVVPGAQGSGLGGELLRGRLSRADADRVPAYLEASSSRSRPFYERHGFRTTGAPIVLPDGPRLWPMWREPRP
jgi:GNAT superfamily N-acetyltransferase